MIENLLYTALATLIVIVLLHIGVFWVSRVIQPPKPRVVYMSQPALLAPQQQQYNTLPQAPIALAPQAPPQVIPEVKLPTYDSPPQAAQKPPPPAMPSLPPPIETRDASRSPPAAQSAS